MKGRTSNFGSRLLLFMALACILLFSGLSYLILSGRDVGNVIGIIHVEGAITSVEGTSVVTSAINEAIMDPQVKGAVVWIDSPGGYAHLVEQVYLDVLELKQRKPVVASIVTALSGGYYIAVGADYIYAHPSSMVGNVGVIGVAPDNLLPSEVNLETGPYKASGFSKLLFPYNLSHALDAFAGAVEEGRGSRLGLSSTELRKGMIYMGSEAINAGLVDEVGSLQKAIEHVAAEAGLKTYSVRDFTAETGTEGVSEAYPNGTSLDWRELTVATLNEMNPPPAIYYLYLPPDAYQTAEESTLETVSDSDTQPPVVYGKGQVVVDLSHGNKVSPWILNLLAAKLAMGGVYMGYADTWDEVESTLDSAACLVVAAPTVAYSEEEWKTIEDWLNKKRMLLMFFDPTSEFMESPALLGPINSLANRYGLTFGKGYLYNMGHHYGIYRNIYVESFADTLFTKDLERIVLFTSTYLHSTDSDAAWTSLDTYSSIAERNALYAPISVITKGNGTVAAFGDITFLMEPWSYVEDNYDLLLNIVSSIEAIEVPIEPEEEEPEYNVSRPDIPIGTVKLFKKWVDGDKEDLWWQKTGEYETHVESEGQITVYTYDEDDALLNWEQDGLRLEYDTPLPDLPYPLTEGKGWAYRVGYTITFEEREFRGILNGSGRVVGFEEVETEKGETYFCVKVFIEETDVYESVAGNRTIVSSENYWISEEVGLVEAVSSIIHYLEGELVDQEQRRLLLVSVRTIGG